MIDLDRAWFRKNPNNNFRVRDPAPGEAEDIMRRSHGALSYEIVAEGGSAPPPDPDMKWSVLVVNVDRETLIKMLTIRPNEESETRDVNGWSIYSVALMNKLFIVKKGG